MLVKKMYPEVLMFAKEKSPNVIKSVKFCKRIVASFNHEFINLQSADVHWLLIARSLINSMLRSTYVTKVV